MAGDYATLAPIYDAIGMGNFALTMTPRLVDFAQRHDWMGRRILDVGCGTGRSLQWLAGHGYVMTGIDNSPEMLQAARRNPDTASLSVRWIEHDIRQPVIEALDTFDMVLAINTLHEMESLRELEIIFKNVAALMGSSRLFIFDMYTIRGLFDLQQENDGIAVEKDNLIVFSKNTFDYDRQIHTRHFVIFNRQDDDKWERKEAERVLRAYPVQAIASLLQRTGLSIKHVLNPSLERYDPGQTDIQRVIFMTEKP